MGKQETVLPDTPQDIYFESDAAIYKHIGRNQIDSETVALIEIVKNSYDADATEVHIVFENADKANGEITVTDNGIGMTPSDFKFYWMRPATSHKEQDHRSLIFRRTMLGRKGMGRFGTDKIACVVEIKSKTRDNPYAFSARIDGDRFDDPGAKFEKTAVKFRPVATVSPSSLLGTFASGTEITMKKPRTKWTKAMIREVCAELGNMISPDGQSANFNITVSTKAYPELSGKLGNSVASGASHEIIINVDNHDTYSATLNGTVLRAGNVLDDCEELLTDVNIESISSETAPTLVKSFGPTHARILYFKDGGLVKRETSKHGKRLDHSGVRVYRSGFRVLPYGEKTDDWMRVRAKRSARGGKYYINPEKMAGFIHIDADNNPKLEDTTNRQALILHDEFQTFRFFFSEVVIEGLNKVLEGELNSVKEEIRKKRHQNVSRQVADILSKLKSDTIKKVVLANTKRHQEEAKKLVQESLLDSNGKQGNRKTRELSTKINPDTHQGTGRATYHKHSRTLTPTDRFVVRPIDAWIENTRWIVREEFSPNEELEAWVNESEQEIVYNSGHIMFIAAELSDKLIDQNLENGCGIAVQMHIHKSVAVAWGLYHDGKDRGAFLSRYKEYEDMASVLIRGNSKFVEEIPSEQLEEVSA